MKFTVLTLFPEMVEQGLRTSILGRAMEKNLIELRVINIRDYTTEKHGRVDDYTYGGGAGMLMQAQPVYDAWKAATEEKCNRRCTVYVTPQGYPFTQRVAQEMARQYDELVILCGHYEGIDERVLDKVVTDYVSIGDYVLTGGELPAMVMIDAIARLVPGVLHNDESALTESFHRDLLEYPQYTRPAQWNGKRVPLVLLSGDHKSIESWRLEQSTKLTEKRRPDLYRRYQEKQAVIRQLLAHKVRNIHLIEGLRRGSTEILYHEGDNLLLFNTESREYLITGCDETRTARADAGERQKLEQGWNRLVDAMWDYYYHAPRILSKYPGVIIIGQTYWKAVLDKHDTYVDSFTFFQACYTQRNPLPVQHRDIRPLSVEDYQNRDSFDRLVDPRESSDYLENRMRAGAMFGIYVDDELAGSMGIHIEGSLGMLYIGEKYGLMHQELAASLEAYCINLQLRQGLTPYIWIARDDKATLRLQEKLGLYVSRELIQFQEDY